MIDKYLVQVNHPLSSYSLAAHYIWRHAFRFLWAVRDETLLLFAEYDRLIYMPIPPVGRPTRRLIVDLLEWMGQRNRNPEAGRIENVVEVDLGLYRSIGCEIRSSFPEYLYRRDSLAALRGDPYKSQRAACNLFEKNHPRRSLEPFRPEDRGECLALYDLWSRRRSSAYEDSYYRALLSDSRMAHEHALNHARSLGLAGRVLRIDGRIEGYTFGFPRGSNTFCVLLETVNPGIKGLSAFIFREFCREMSDYAFVNTLDDSGLENLRRTKLTYRPIQLVTPYAVRLGPTTD
jgi:hypothetical protein